MGGKKRSTEVKSKAPSNLSKAKISPQAACQLVSQQNRQSAENPNRQTDSLSSEKWQQLRQALEALVNLYWGKFWLDLMFLSALNDSPQYGESGDRCPLVAPCLAVICWLPVKGSKIPFFVLCMHRLKTCLANLLSQLSTPDMLSKCTSLKSSKEGIQSSGTSQIWLQHGRTHLTYL